MDARLGNTRDTSRVALKIVFLLSLLLVIMDVLEITYSFKQLQKAAALLNSYFFENCIKYHIISQIFFTSFATFAGIAACLMSFALIINFNFFQEKLIMLFFYWNYLIFGPYLFVSTLLSFFYFKDVVYYCNTDINLSKFYSNEYDLNEINFNKYVKKYFNFSILMSIIICLLFSMFITLAFSFYSNYKMIHNSITFQNEGNRVLGRLFWDYVFNRNDDRLINNNQSNNNTYNRTNIIYQNNENRNLNNIDNVIGINGYHNYDLNAGLLDN